jgi:hypothetical protein
LVIAMTTKWLEEIFAADDAARADYDAFMRKLERQRVMERLEAEQKASRAAREGRTADFEYWRDRAVELRKMEVSNDG